MLALRFSTRFTRPVLFARFSSSSIQKLPEHSTPKSSKPEWVERLLARRTAREMEAAAEVHVVEKFLEPEPVSTNLEQIFRTTRNMVSALPRAPSHFPFLIQKKRSMFRKAFGGDYDPYKVPSKGYLKGSLGHKTGYSQIILQHNRSLTDKDRLRLVDMIKKGTREDTHLVKN